MMQAIEIATYYDLKGSVGCFAGGSNPLPVAETINFDNALNLPSLVWIFWTLAPITYSSRWLDMKNKFKKIIFIYTYEREKKSLCKEQRKQ